jgi:MipA family protein
MIRLLPVAALALAPLAASAQSADGPGLAFTLGVGVESVPEYFGSDEQTVGPGFSFDLGYVGIGSFSFGSREFDAVSEGWGFRGSFRYVSERSGDDFEGAGRIADPVDAAFELGGGVRYSQPWWEVHAVARKGFGGHHGLVADVGMDLIARPTERLSLRAGPRLFYGDDEYAETYFSATAPGFDASGGLLSSGLEVGAEYRLTETWGVSASVRYDRLRNDAAESPITEEDDQVSADLLVTRRFDIEF